MEAFEGASGEVLAWPRSHPIDIPACAVARRQLLEVTVPMHLVWRDDRPTKDTRWLVSSTHATAQRPLRVHAGAGD